MKDTLRILFVLVFTTVLSCKNNNVKVNNSINVETPTIIDTSNFKSIKRNSTWLEVVEYTILYMGDQRDTIYPIYNNIDFYPPPPSPPTFPKGKNEDSVSKNLKKIDKNIKTNPYVLDYFENKEYRWYYDTNIKITVDTLQKIKKENIFTNVNVSFFDAYPIIIKSKEKDTIKIGSGNKLPIVLEAKDSIGNWKPIEEQFKYGCGTGLNGIILPPKTIIVSSVMIYKGNYKTKLRIKLGENFSNEFNGTINYRQFESMFDSSGRFKKAFLNEKK